MAGGIELIAPIEPKNNGEFPMVYGKDVDVDGRRLPEILAGIEGGEPEAATEGEIDSIFE